MGNSKSSLSLPSLKNNEKLEKLPFEKNQFEFIVRLANPSDMDQVLILLTSAHIEYDAVYVNKDLEAYIWINATVQTEPQIHLHIKPESIFDYPRLTQYWFSKGNYKLTCPGYTYLTLQKRAYELKNQGWSVTALSPITNLSNPCIYLTI